MTKQTLIMIHGFRGTHHGLQLIKDELAQFEVIVPDLPGFGEGDRLSAYDLADYVKWLHGYISDLGLSKPPILLGHSFGSIIASAYAAEYPETIEKLILENPIGAPALEGPRQVMTKLAIFYYWLGRKLPKGMAHTWLSSKAVTDIMSQTMAKTKDKALRAFIFDQHRTYFSRFHSADSVAQGFNTSVSYSVRDFAPLIKVPTLLIVGDRDDITSLTQQKELQKKFASESKMAIMQNVGHLTHYETPREVAAAIQSFAKDS